jgi:hypothetical protein
MKDGLFQWVKANQNRFLILFGMVLVGGLCFEAGLIQGKLEQKSPLVLSIPESPQIAQVKQPEADATVLATNEVSPGSNDYMVPIVARTVESGNCAFVGSKNSNKYHLPSCAVAKRIKPENRRCFTSKEDAERQGYVPSCVE